MKIPFSVLYFFFSTAYIFFVLLAQGITDDTTAEDKSSFPIHHHQHVCIRESALWRSFSASCVSTLFHLHDSIRPLAGPHHVCSQGEAVDDAGRRICYD